MLCFNLQEKIHEFSLLFIVDKFTHDFLGNIRRHNFLHCLISMLVGLPVGGRENS